MATTYFLAPNPRFQLRDVTGQPAAFGTLGTYQAGTLIPLATFSDPAGVNPNANPVVMDAKGEANIYWQHFTDPEIPTLYRLIAHDAQGNLIYDQDNYPTDKDTNDPPPPDNASSDNFIRNPQFSSWSNSTNYPAYGTTTNIFTDYAVDDWYFERSNLNATISISQGVFTLSQTDVPGNPLYYVDYECTAIGAAGEIFKDFGQLFKSVQTLSGQQVSFAFWAKSGNGFANTITVGVKQDFGSGGSPSADLQTAILTANLTTTWTYFKGTVTLPNVGGKTLGTNGDDHIVLVIGMPINTVASVQFTNTQLQNLDEPSSSFPYLTPDEQTKRINTLVDYATFRTADVKMSFRALADPGWLLMDDGTIGATLSNANHPGFFTQALFTQLWNNINILYAPVYNSDGTFGSKGASAAADFNANKQIGLPLVLGRILAGAAPAGTFFQKVFTVSGSNLIINDTTPFHTGDIVALTTTATLPSPLVVSTNYAVIVVNTTTIQLATSVANAVAGTAITLTGAGSGTMILNCAIGIHTLGQYLGEETHAQTPAEIALHAHSYVISSGSSTFASGSGFAQNSGFATPTGNAGLSTAFNIMQPTTYANFFIKL